MTRRRGTVAKAASVGDPSGIRLPRGLGRRRLEFLLVSLSPGSDVCHLDRRRGDVHHIEFARQRLDDRPNIREVSSDQMLSDRRLRDLETTRPQVRHRRKRDDIDLLPGELFDRAKQSMLPAARPG